MDDEDGREEEHSVSAVPRVVSYVQTARESRVCIHTSHSGLLSPCSARFPRSKSSHYGGGLRWMGNI